MERKLTAILCADVFGYSRLMGEDEEATLRTLSSHRKTIDALIEHHHGRFVNSAGDSVLAEFASVVNAVQCAVDVQTALKADNDPLPPERRMEFRIGVNLGDVMVEGEQIYGDGVNVAARLESLAEPGGVCISGTVHDHVSTKLALSYSDLGEQAVKNIAKPVRVFRVLPNGTVAMSSRTSRRYWRSGVLSLTGLAIIVGTMVLVQHLSLRPTRTHASIPPQEKPALPLPDKPSIAVLPFINISGDREQEYFSDGITEDLVTDLSRLPGLFVIDSSSTFSYRRKLTKVQDVGHELGVKYVLEGSARREADQIRINVQLVDAERGRSIWAQRYDEQFRNVFAVQDKIVESIIATLDVQLPLLQKGYDFMPQRTKNLEAYDLMLRGYEYFLQSSPEGIIKARQMWDRATELDPDYADAYTLLSISYFIGYIFQWDRDPEALDRAVRLANKTIALDDSNALAYTILSYIAAFRGDREKAIADGNRAASLAPNSAFVYDMLAHSNLALDGSPEQELNYAERAMRLDPRHASGYWAHVGWAYSRMGRLPAAIAAFQNSSDQSNPFVHVWLACDYAELGREHDARAEVGVVLRLSPSFTVEGMQQRVPAIWRNSKRAQCLAELRNAGLK